MNIGDKVTVCVSYIDADDGSRVVEIVEAVVWNFGRVELSVIGFKWANDLGDHRINYGTCAYEDEGVTWFSGIATDEEKRALLSAQMILR